MMVVEVLGVRWLPVPALHCYSARLGRLGLFLLFVQFFNGLDFFLQLHSPAKRKCLCEIFGQVTPAEKAKN